MSKINSESITKLRILLASWAVFRQKAHTYHWNVKGSDFKTLHEWFNELYDSSQDNMDLIAERLRQLGEKIPMSLLSASQESAIPDENAADSPSGIVEDIVSALGILATVQGEICMESNDQNDNVTMDLMIQISKWVEMKSWFLSAYLGKENDSKA
jgi:starvation-inducible DNA-binding protein